MLRKKENLNCKKTKSKSKIEMKRTSPRKFPSPPTDIMQNFAQCSLCTHTYTHTHLYIKYITYRHRHTYTPTHVLESKSVRITQSKARKKYCLLFLADFLSEKNQVIRATLRKQVCITFCVAKCKCKCPHFSVSHTYSIVANKKKQI